MKGLQLFNYEEHQVRVLGTAEEPLFVAKDLADMLGYDSSRNALKHLDDDEKQTVILGHSGQKRRQYVVTESGMWCLLIRSNKPDAKKIRKWVTSEVLAAIRRTGSYELADQGEYPPRKITVGYDMNELRLLMTNLAYVKDDYLRKAITANVNKLTRTVELK